MSSVTAYVLNADGSLLCTRTGNIENVLYAVDVENLEYTLQPPPTFDRQWYWYNNQWNDKPSN